MTIALQPGILYGPMASRRFGVSLGINLLPEGEKWCTYSCVYCQYADTGHSGGLTAFPTLKDIKHALAHPYDRNTKLDWITIAGNGEPTMHPQFSVVVDEVLRFRDKYYKGVPVGILTNASTCHRQAVREALMRLDGRFMKLDAGNLSMFKKINRPEGDALWSFTLQGLKKLPAITLQSMFVTGEVDNTGAQDVEDWIRLVEEIHPESVQIYTVDRPCATENILSVSKDELLQIADRLESMTGVRCEVYD